MRSEEERDKKVKGGEGECEMEECGEKKARISGMEIAVVEWKGCEKGEGTPHVLYKVRESCLPPQLFDAHADGAPSFFPRTGNSAVRGSGVDVAWTWRGCGVGAAWTWRGQEDMHVFSLGGRTCRPKFSIGVLIS